MPRGGCHLWTDDVLYLQIITNLLISAAYFTIPTQILMFFKGKELDGWFKVVVILFASFVFSCGIGHALKVVMIWWPAYHLEGWWDALTALISVATAIALTPA